MTPTTNTYFMLIILESFGLAICITWLVLLLKRLIVMITYYRQVTKKVWVETIIMICLCVWGGYSALKFLLLF